MEITHVHNDIKYVLSNDDIKVGDKVFPISNGKITDGIYEHHKFDFRDFMSGFPDEPHTILDVHHTDYKPYECRTDHGYSPIEKYFKIIS